MATLWESTGTQHLRTHSTLNKYSQQNTESTQHGQCTANQFRIKQLCIEQIIMLCPSSLASSSCFVLHTYERCFRVVPLLTAHACNRHALPSPRPSLSACMHIVMQLVNWEPPLSARHLCRDQLCDVCSSVWQCDHEQRHANSFTMKENCFAFAATEPWILCHPWVLA